LVVVVFGRRQSLASSLGDLRHPHWSWIAVAVVLEAGSMTTFAMMQGRLLRVGGACVRRGSMLATTLAANALSVSVPIVGSQLGAAFAYKRFRKFGADSSLAGWTFVIGGLVSSLGAVVIIAVGGAVSGNIDIAGLAALTVFCLTLTALMSLGPWRDGVRRVTTRLVIPIVRCASRFNAEAIGDPSTFVKCWVDRFHSIRPSKAEWGKVGVLGISNWLTDCGVLAASILALGAAVPWRPLLLIYGLATLIGSLGLTPGGIGLVEGTLCLGLVGAGVPAALALSAVLLYRLVSFWLVGATGWLVFGYLRLRNREPTASPGTGAHAWPRVRRAMPGTTFPNTRTVASTT
jgi:uncharacterized protein (TIRG00374 family)